MISRRQFLKLSGARSPKATLPFISPHFFTLTHQPVTPELLRESWQLELTSPQLAEPLFITWEILSFFPAVETFQTIECIGNPAGGDLIGNANWRGVRLRDVLPPEMHLPHLNFKAADGYQTSLPLEIARQPSTLLAFEMNGEPLPIQHGFPVRLLVAGMYGLKMPKWITQIQASEQAVLGFWEQLGWSSSGIVQTHAAFTHPPDHTQITGKIQLAGYAYAGSRKIVKVEISVDGGEWIPADLIQPNQSPAWTLWFLDWQPASLGQYHLAVRAIDEDGNTQTEFPNPILKKQQLRGNRLIHAITLEVV